MSPSDTYASILGPQLVTQLKEVVESLGYDALLTFKWTLKVIGQPQFWFVSGP